MRDFGTKDAFDGLWIRLLCSHTRFPLTSCYLLYSITSVCMGLLHPQFSTAWISIGLDHSGVLKD
jgi:hypothetical protein